MIIRDGVGAGYCAEVDATNHLKVASRSQELAFLKASQGLLHMLSSNVVNLTANGGQVIYYEHLDTSKMLVVEKITLGWNGGNTNRNRSVKTTYTFGNTAPTTNATPVVGLRSTNLGSANTLNGTFYRWNGVGDGMTGGNPGATLSETLMPAGFHTVPLGGAFVFPAGSRIAVQAYPDEAGTYNITFYVYLIDPLVDIS